MTKDEVRFHSLYKKMPSGCWEWQGARQKKHKGKWGKNVKDYGFCRLNGKLMMTHRISWILFKGPIPKGNVVMHTCDNPPCCNPDHLKIGTQADNLRDMQVKGRGRNATSHYKP